MRAAGSTALTYIEPIALKAGKKMDWTQVYQTHGKMSDVKMADARNSRMVILEDGASAEEFKKAVAILEQSATVRDAGQDARLARGLRGLSAARRQEGTLVRPSTISRPCSIAACTASRGL